MKLFICNQAKNRSPTAAKLLGGKFTSLYNRENMLTKELLKIGFGVLYNNWFEPNTLYIMVPLSILSNKKETNEIIIGRRFI